MADDGPYPFLRQAWVPYGAAIGLVIAMFFIRLAIQSLAPTVSVSLLFTLAALVPAILGGLWPGLFGTLIALPAIYYFLATRPDQVAGGLVSLLLFAIVGATIAVLGGQLHGARRVSTSTRRELTRTEAHLQSILEAVPDAAVVVNPDGSIVSFNRTAIRQFGYEPAEVAGQNVNLLLPAAHRDHAETDLARLITSGANGSGTEHVVVGRRKDGSTFPMKLAVGETDTGDHHYFTAFIRDVTERQESAARLEEAQGELARLARLNELGEMASTLAHELNQPLSAITNYVQGSARLVDQIGGEQAGRIRFALAETAKQALRAGDIIRHLREFVTRGDTEKHPEDIRSIVEEAGALALVGARERNVRSQFNFDPSPAMVMADRVQIQQVLTNLMRNAMEAMKDSPTRELSLTTRLLPGDMLEVVVADTGPGIAPEIASRLFQPFVTSKPSGMGIGLSISRRIIQAHGGDIVVTSNAAGGATFTFTLPVMDAAEVEAARAASGRTPRHG